MTNDEIIEFKRFIELRLTSSSYLGTYTFKNQQVRPACCLLPDNTLGLNYPPPDTVVTGIECVIMKPEMNHKRFFNGYQLRNKFNIYLKDFGNGSHLYSATTTVFNSAFEYGYELTNPIYISGNKLKNIIPQSNFSAIHWENVPVQSVV